MKQREIFYMNNATFEYVHLNSAIAISNNENAFSFTFLYNMCRNPVFRTCEHVLVSASSYVFTSILARFIFYSSNEMKSENIRINY